MTVDIVFPFASVKFTTAPNVVVDVLFGIVTVIVEPAGQKELVVK